jgi:hypothetical protein
VTYGIKPDQAQRRYDETFDAVLNALQKRTIPAGETQMPIRTRQVPDREACHARRVSREQRFA